MLPIALLPCSASISQLPPPTISFVVTVPPEKTEEEKNSTDTMKNSTDLHSQATSYARLADSEALKAGSVRCNVEEENLNMNLVISLFFLFSAKVLDSFRIGRL
ncbi:putative Alpha/beta-Hydrolases superfamily protein [Hibiscus syriacus]|uniref:Alpha/beta-Hydrolases superfamily protein n=1 Tax=Hibiscus syriacus TaxID=106335 RepID=A0A6A3C5V5_HIBSY|nr:putative Alpha/beta-Hydrolases superfamily protein [Hibiscus syriacus]